MSAAAVRAAFSNYRLVPSRNVLQLVLEIPCEQQTEAFAALGYPIPGQDIWVAVARLQNPVDSPPVRPPANPPEIADTGPEGANRSTRSARARERFAQLPEAHKIVTRAALLAKDPEFQQWSEAISDEEAAAFIRRACAVLSRRDLATDARARERFNRLANAFELAVGRRAEVRG